MAGISSPDRSAGAVVVIRHGKPEWNATRRFQERAAVGLNERGRQQARALGEDLQTVFDNHSHENCAVSEFRIAEDVAVICTNRTA